MSEGEVTPERLAKKWFVLAFFGALAYFSVVFYFVLTPEVDPSDIAPAVVLHD